MAVVLGDTALALEMVFHPHVQSIQTVSRQTKMMLAKFCGEHVGRTVGEHVERTTFHLVNGHRLTVQMLFGKSVE